jgi:hypothetical protein
MKNRSHYSDDVAKRIEINYKQTRIYDYKENGNYNELSTLLYVAAMIKSQASLPVIQTIWLDQKKFEDDCIYCCPRSLVLAVFAIHGLWTPPALSEEQSRCDSVENTLSQIKYFKYFSATNKPLENSNIEGTDEWTREAKIALSLNDDQLLENATNSKAAHRKRYAAAEELSRRVSDDRHLVDYYWWALNTCEDDSGEYLCYAHDSILQAEFFNAKGKITKNR